MTRFAQTRDTVRHDVHAIKFYHVSRLAVARRAVSRLAAAGRSGVRATPLRAL
jgi:hypothetical protein